MAPSLSMSQCHLYAQKLNNSAALCIEIGHYDRAIFSLTKALRLSRVQSDESMMIGSSCDQYSIDGCISYSEITCPVSGVSNHSLSNDLTGSGYIYQRPIRVPPECIIENHNMGRTLFLIITFNLAMAHHLGAMVATSRTSCESDCEDRTAPNPLQTNNKIKKALQLYEISHSWHSRITSEQTSDESGASQTFGVSSIRFRMILSNNMSHIYRLGSNNTKHRQCLEHLLSTVMIAVDYKTRTNTNNNATTETLHNTDLRSSNLEGFLMNASKLFVEEHCAEAA